LGLYITNYGLKYLLKLQDVEDSNGFAHCSSADVSHLSHFVLDVSPLPDLCVLLDLLAPQGDVRQLVAQPAALSPAIGILAVEHFVLLGRRVHDCGKLAKGAALESLDVGLFHFCQLDLLDPLAKDVGVERALQGRQVENVIALAETGKSDLALADRDLKGQLS
jgi:hypothetical protein